MVFQFQFKKIVARPFYTIHDVLRCLGLMQSLLKGRVAPIWRPWELTLIRLSGTDGLNKKVLVLIVFIVCGALSYWAVGWAFAYGTLDNPNPHNLTLPNSEFNTNKFIGSKYFFSLVYLIFKDYLFTA